MAEQAEEANENLEAILPETVADLVALVERHLAAGRLWLWQGGCPTAQPLFPSSVRHPQGPTTTLLGASCSTSLPCWT